MSDIIARRSNWRILAWSAAAALILLPLVAMRFTSEVNWSAADFAVAIAMIGGAGLAFEGAVRLSSSLAYRAGIACALLAMVLLVWINSAVGIIGSEEHPANALFLVVIITPIVGAVVTRFRARGMTWAMVAAAVAQAGVAVAARMLADAAIVPITIVFVVLWLAAAWLFARAAREQ